MQSFKDSGADTIGYLPRHWQKRRLKYLCRIRTGDQDTQNATPDGQYPFYVRSPIPERCDRYTFDGEGILVAGDGAGAGRVFHHVFGKYAVHQRVYRLSDFRFHSRFIYYWLSLLFPFEMDKGSAQSTVPSMRLPMLLNFPVFLPPIEEARAIAAFLDHQCGEIESLVNDIRTEMLALEQYKASVITEAVTKGIDAHVEMRASGLPWVQCIPKAWTVIRLGYICKKLLRKGSKEAPILICSNAGKVIHRDDKHTGLISEKEEMFQGVEQGDLLIHGMDTWHGAIAVSPYSGKCSTVVHVCDSSENKVFLSYYLQMLAMKNVYKAISNGIRGNTSDFRSWEKAKTIKVALPASREEQNRIARYLTEKCHAIERTLDTMKNQIQTLEEYKQSLIFEYVTGKKEVPAS